MMALAARADTEPLAFIANRDLFGDIADDPRFADAYLEALTSLRERGARHTLEELVAAVA
jgi:mannitol 2-dehydrogenase